MSNAYRILACTDLSPRSRIALDCASRLADAADVELTLAHVVEHDRADQRERTERALRAIAEEHERSMAIAVIRADAGESVESRIVRYAAELPADMIAMHAPDVSMLGHLLNRNVALEVAAATAAPVMVVGEAVASPAPGRHYHVLVTTDGSDASIAVLSSIRPLLTLPNVRATILRVHEPRLGDRGRMIEMESCDQQLASLRPLLPPEASVDCLAAEVDGLESIQHAIVRVARDINADAVAMASRGQTRAHHVLVGSVTLAVVKHAPVPVIMARS